MKRVLIHYFSGTGNTYRASKLLTQKMKKPEYNIEFHAIEKGLKKDLVKFDLHIFAFPVYATAIPHIMKKYLLSLPNGKNTDTVVISTNGRISTKFRDGFEGHALREAKRILTRKQFNIFLTETFDYPHNVINFFPPRNENANKKIISMAETKVNEISKLIINRKRHIRKYFILNWLWSKPFGILYSWIGRRFIGKLFSADPNCNGCGLCARSCPAKAIEMLNKQPRWNLNCEGCQHCINFCPTQSIQTSLLRLLAIFIPLFYNPLSFIFKYVQNEIINIAGKTGAEIIFIILYFILYIITVMILDFIMSRLNLIPALNRVTSWGHTSLYRRYKAPSFKLQI